MLHGICMGALAPPPNYPVPPPHKNICNLTPRKYIFYGFNKRGAYDNIIISISALLNNRR